MRKFSFNVPYDYFDELCRLTPLVRHRLETVKRNMDKTGKEYTKARIVFELVDRKAMFATADYLVMSKLICDTLGLEFMSMEERLEPPLSPLPYLRVHVYVQ